MGLRGTAKMLRMIIRLAIPAGAACLLANCATVTRGTTSEVKFESEPSAAQVTLSTGQTCTTPCTMNLPRSQGFVTSFAKEGFKPAQVTVTTQVQGAGTAGLAGNLLVGGVVGVVVDAASGASLDHVPNPVRAVLEPAGRATPPVRTPTSRPVPPRGAPTS